MVYWREETDLFIFVFTPVMRKVPCILFAINIHLTEFNHLWQRHCSSTQASAPQHFPASLAVRSGVTWWVLGSGMWVEVVYALSSSGL